jgi:hypothetical protein
VAKIIEDGLETCVAMRGKFQSLGNRVDEPPEQDLGGAPTPITFEKLLDRDRLLMKGVGGIQGAKDFINRMKQDPAGDATTTGVALDQITKIINVHIGVRQGECMRLAAGDVNRGKGCGHTGHTRRKRHIVLDGRTVLYGRTAGRRARGTRARGHRDRR